MPKLFYTLLSSFLVGGEMTREIASFMRLYPSAEMTRETAWMLHTTTWWIHSPTLLWGLRWPTTYQLKRTPSLWAHSMRWTLSQAWKLGWTTQARPVLWSSTSGGQSLCSPSPARLTLKVLTRVPKLELLLLSNPEEMNAQSLILCCGFRVLI